MTVPFVYPYDFQEIGIWGIGGSDVVPGTFLTLPLHPYNLQEILYLIFGVIMLILIIVEKVRVVLLTV